MMVRSIASLVIGIVGLLGCMEPLWAQTDVTPYSSQGLGNLIRPSLVHNRGMGGIGVGSGNALFINYTNPAFLYKNNLSSFDVAFSIEQNIMQREEESVNRTSGGLSYGIFSFPVVPGRWSMSVGVAPYSAVGYRIEEPVAVQGGEETGTQIIDGEGGLNIISVSNGVRVVDNLGVGLRIGYIFGPITETRSVILSDPQANRTELEDQIYYSDLIFEPSLSYGIKLGNNTLLNMGATYQPEMKVRATREVTLRNIPPGANQPILGDVVDSAANNQRNITLPARLGFGISVEKSLKYLVGVDFLTQPWENYRSFSGTNDGMKNSYELSVGGQYIPDISSVDSYLARMAYRLGFYYRNTPFAVEDRQITDFGVNLGLSLPMSNLSSVNLALEAGNRGTLDIGLIRENYFKISAGITFNDRWFIRRKFD
uniref:Long-chain fatty acid transport protein n=1 Tax=Roseihalotalea indica TaxID=2867963 RepID=A0AA49GTX3_9BACT|nr:hypothetical protein K4G66_03635 [Tunicatimonas sp. TK19036]